MEFVSLFADVLMFTSKQTPPNGLVLYCGTVITDEGKEKKVTYDFEPYSPINTSLYLCDNKFHTEVELILYFYLLFLFPPFVHLFCYIDEKRERFYLLGTGDSVKSWNVRWKKDC